MTPIHLTDGYKVDHIHQYPEGTEHVYSNMTARGSRLPGVNHIVVFGIQYFVLKYLVEEFDNNFFHCDKETVIRKYKKRIDSYLGVDVVPLDHIEALHNLGYLPIRLRALPEGTVVPMRVPFLTIENTRPEFFWLTNFLETMMSAAIWHPITVATIAFEYRKLLQQYAQVTSDNPEFVKWQGHDFSMRGQTSIESASVSGIGHLLSFTGTDTIPAIDMAELYYGASGVVGGSVAATEHSVMCFGGETTEFETYKRLITKVYPKGIVSIVSDTWDYWKVLTETLPKLKSQIMQREGKVVVRPDSGDPVKIICGDDTVSVLEPARVGTVELLWRTFGGRINSKGYKELDPHIGVIYGDSITLERAQQICEQLKQKGFASTNVVFGIGSYTYQYVTRDTFGFAIKATAGMINGEEVHVSKNPKTDPGLKKSARGFLTVERDDKGELVLRDGLSYQESLGGLLETVFVDGVVITATSLGEIRERIDKAVIQGRRR